MKRAFLWAISFGQTTFGHVLSPGDRVQILLKSLAVVCLATGCANTSVGPDWVSHHRAALALLEAATRECSDLTCIDQSLMAACRSWGRAEREAENLYLREPLMAIDAACVSLEMELEQGSRASWQFFFNDIATAAEELDVMLNGG